MQKTTMKSSSLAEMKDKYIGKVGTEERDTYEYELNMDVLSRMIKKARQERNLTQEQLGKLIGVQKAQISKLESSANSATVETDIIWVEGKKYWWEWHLQGKGGSAVKRELLLIKIQNLRLICNF
jgi:DNA-binding XRE family transcriptional regulator